VTERLCCFARARLTLRSGIKTMMASKSFAREDLVGSREAFAEQVPHPARVRCAGIRGGVSWNGERYAVAGISRGIRETALG